jgi:general secretion pathway protein K
MTMRARPLPFFAALLVARAAQRGAAIITALLVVALSAILVSGMLWRQQVQIRRIENVLAQAQWVARGALDWTRMILRSEADTAPGITYLGGSGPCRSRSKLSDFLGRIGAPNDNGGEDTYISGSIEDAQAKYNLRNSCRRRRRARAAAQRHAAAGVRAAAATARHRRPARQNAAVYLRRA